WREVLRLICGQIDEQFVGRIIKHLATRKELDAPRISGILDEDTPTWDEDTPLPALPQAIGCLSEVRNASRLEAVGGGPLTATVRCFLEGKRPPQDFMLDIVAAAREMGTRWPGKNVFKFVGQYPKSDPYYHHWRWPHFLASVFEQRAWIESLARCESWDVR